MTWNLAQTMSLIKAAQHKYTHRKLVGRDSKTGRPRYRYYYARHHGGGITSAKFEEGSAFRLTFKGRTGHFHVESVDGDMVTVRHDGRKGSKPIEMSRDELRALLERQHSKLETASREKAQKRRKSAAKKRKSTKRQAPAKRPQLSVADQVEEHRGQLLDQAKALKERIKGLDKKKDKEEIARLRDEAGALSGAALLAQRAQRDGIESAGPMIQKQIEQTQRMIGRSDNAEHTARLTRDLEQKRKLLDIIEGKTQVEPERPKRKKAQSETAQQAPQRSQTAQAFSSMVDTIKSGERSQAAQRAFKTELNKVIDKAESGTLTDAERAELLPIAEQLVEVTSGRARGLMTAVRDQIKGSSEDSEPQTPSAEYKQTRAEILKETYGDFDRKKIKELEQRLKTQQGPDSEQASEAHVNSMLALVKTPEMKRLINDVVANHKGTSPPRRQLDAITQYIAEQAPARAPQPEDQSLESLEYEITKVRERATSDLEKVGDELIPSIISELDAQRDAAYNAIPSEPQDERRKAQAEFYKRDALAMATRHAYSTAINSAIQERTSQQIQELEQLIFDKKRERAEERARAKEAK